MRGDLAALTLLLLVASVAEARVATSTESLTRLASVIPIELVAGNTGSTTLGANHTSATTSLGPTPRVGAPPTLLWLESRSEWPQTVWLRVEPTSDVRGATCVLAMAGEAQVIYAAGIGIRTEGKPRTLAPHARLAIQGMSERVSPGHLDLAILSHPQSDAGQTLHEHWKVTG